MGQSRSENRPNPGKLPQFNIPRRPDAERRHRQADRLARILKLLELLQVRSALDARALAVALATTERTVYRDLKVLELAGISSVYDASRGGYVLQNDCRFAVTALTDDELLGQATAAVLTRAKGLDVGVGAEATTRKLQATGRESAANLLKDAQRVTAVLDLKLADHEGHKDIILTIQRALIKKKCLEGTYASPYRPETKVVILHPIRLCLVKQAWYLIARPADSSHPVTYRVARFRSVRKLHLTSDVPFDFDLRAISGMPGPFTAATAATRSSCASCRRRHPGAGNDVALHAAGLSSR